MCLHLQFGQLSIKELPNNLFYRYEIVKSKTILNSTAKNILQVL